MADTAPAGPDRFRSALRAALSGCACAVVRVADGRRFSGADLVERAGALAAMLAGRGLRPGNRILLLLPNGMALATAYLACALHRLVAVPMNPKATTDDVGYAVALARPALVLSETQPEGLDGTPWLAFDDAALEALPPGRPPVTAMEEDDLLSINFTSGSTSRPKAVVHRAEGLLGNADAFNRATGFGPDDRMLHAMPMYYMAGFLNTLICPWLAGATVVLDAQFSPRSALTVFRRAEDHGVTAFWLSPTMVQMAMQLDRGTTAPAWLSTRVRHPFVGTAPLSPGLAGRFAERYGARLLQSYGLSELLLLAVDDPARTRFGSVGFAIPGVAVRLADDGEILVSNATAFAGYLDPATGAAPDAATAARMRLDFPTGDLGRIDPDGRLTVTGRKKDLLIVGGVNVSPTHVEEALGEHEAVDRVAVVGAAHPVLGECPVAFVVPRGTRPADELEAALRRFAEARLQAAERPVRWVFRRDMPAGPTGKIMKHLLSEDAPA